MTEEVKQSEAKTVEKPVTPTLEERVTALETNHQNLLKKLRKSIAFFDRK